MVKSYGDYLIKVMKYITGTSYKDIFSHWLIKQAFAKFVHDSQNVVYQIKNWISSFDHWKLGHLLESLNKVGIGPVYFVVCFSVRMLFCVSWRFQLKGFSTLPKRISITVRSLKQ